MSISPVAARPAAPVAPSQPPKLNYLKRHVSRMDDDNTRVVSARRCLNQKFNAVAQANEQLDNNNC